MKNYTYQNTLISKKQLRQLLAWSFTNYDSIQACTLADELKHLGFKYATQAGISISIEDLKIPFVKNLMLEKANNEIINAEKIYLNGKITDVERFQTIIDTWNLTSESLKEQVVHYFKNYDPLNSVYIMAFSGARGNLSQVRQLVGMRGLMSDPSGEIMKLPIKKNFREGLTITDYLMSGYGARKGIVDTALKTANSGYLTRRLIDVGQDILIREKDCLTTHSFLFSIKNKNKKKDEIIFEKILGRVLNKPVFDSTTNKLLAHSGEQITPNLIEIFKEKKVAKLYIRSPFTCSLYRAICQKCYGWDLASETLVDIGEAIGILAGQSIGEPGTQLTMRTFHTGGVFTSEARRQILSPGNGVIRFSKSLKIVPLRTNRGEDVLIAKNSGSLVLISEMKKLELFKIQIPRNTIIFPKNNQYVSKNVVIGELINTNRQIKSEIKPILSDTCGEIFIPYLRKNNKSLINNKLFWILVGQLYNAPMNSSLNFHPDYKLNKNSHIFRTKITSHYKGLVKITNSKKNLYQRLIEVINNKLSLFETKLYRLRKTLQQKNYILDLKNSKYLLKVKEINSSVYLQLTRKKQIGVLLTNAFKTLTGGNLFYDHRNLRKFNQINSQIFYVWQNSLASKFNTTISYRTIVWLSEETHLINCEPNILLVENGDFISEKFELIPGLFSKTSGIVTIKQKNSLVQTISIKPGLVYEGNQFKNISKKLYYPGELIISNISITNLAFCEHITSLKNDKLLIRPIEIYELPYSNEKIKLDQAIENQVISLDSKFAYSYKPKQAIKGSSNVTLISATLLLKLNQLLKSKDKIELIPNGKRKSVHFCFNEKLLLNNYINPGLRYKNIQSSLLIQPHQFIDKYTVLGYLEAITPNPLEIVKIKIKKLAHKQILLISNKDCLVVSKEHYSNKKLNDFIIGAKTGKVIIENKNLLTLQRGRPYFFPNCSRDFFVDTTNLQYKIVPTNRIFNRAKNRREISINYQNLTKLSLNKKNNLIKNSSIQFIAMTEFSKLFLKLNGKLYSTLIPQFSKKFSLKSVKSNSKFQQFVCPNNLTFDKMDRTLLFKSSEIKKNPYHSTFENDYQLTLIKFQEQPFFKTIKAVGLHSITEDYFEQEVNSVFCKNNKFVEAGETLGLLNLEKEITDDIVQGLPRIEEILEARKKNLTTKRLPVSQKKGLLLQKTSLDPSFDFQKLGTAIKENEKINPHRLLKVYFNYYGLVKSFTCEWKQQIKYNYLIKNYEGSYKSFKKVQAFILDSVQSVYRSQGVTINDKHLEVVIKQMTTKVLITYEGNAPLLRREVVDLYHIQYINEIIESQKKETAYYVPLLLGITKAALNNPSFISAASFQETTRVLTKAAIEGRIDWLRGLKENIIIGHLIPAGTGSPTYRNCFKPPISKKKPVNINFMTNH